MLAFVATAATFATSVAPSAAAASPPLTVAQYRVHAKAICAKANRDQNNAGALPTMARRLAYDLDVARTAYVALVRLTPPTQLERWHKAMLADTKTLLAEAPILIQAAKKGEAAFARVSAEESARNAATAREVARLWVRLGVPSCNAS